MNSYEPFKLSLKKVIKKAARSGNDIVEVKGNNVSIDTNAAGRIATNSGNNAAKTV